MMTLKRPFKKAFLTSNKLMYLHKIYLKNFRNLEQVEFSPGQKLNVLWGNNGQGKTNLLEAIYYLGFLKSFRGVRNDELITLNQKITSLKARVDKNSVQHELAVSWSRQTRSSKIDSKAALSVTDFIGLLPSIIFSPEEINLIRAYPIGRRNLLDRAIYLTQAGYANLVREYQRQLRQRNQLLKERHTDREIKPWTEGLIKNGAKLRRVRINYLKRLVPWLIKAYAEICQEKESVDLRYPGDDSEDQENILVAEFEKVAKRERDYGQTLAGPHRDDPLFILNGESLKSFGSQGQQRSFILAFKYAQVLDFEEVSGEQPLLLLDDLTSELDCDRRRALIDFVQQRQGQVFITTADKTRLFDDISATARMFQLREGVVHES